MPRLDGHNFYLNRLLPNGQQDTSFTPLVVDFFGSDDLVYALAMQPGGKILVCGSSYIDTTERDEFACIRSDTSGNLDTSFGTSGKMTAHVNSTAREYLISVVVRDDASFIGCGATGSGGFRKLALVSFSANGTVDTSFGASGFAVHDLSPVGRDSECFGMALQSSGKIVMGGYIQDTGGTYKFATARFESNGSLDTTYRGGDGFEYLSINGGGSDQKGRGVVVHNDDVYVGGFTSTASGYDHGIVKFTPSGIADTSYGPNGDGTVKLNIATGLDDWSYLIAMDRQNRIYLSGAVSTASYGRDLSMIRLDANGALDTSFNATGVVSGNFSDTGTLRDQAAALVQHPNGSLIICGYATLASVSGNSGLVRFYYP